MGFKLVLSLLLCPLVLTAAALNADSAPEPQELLPVNALIKPLIRPTATMTPERVDTGKVLWRWSAVALVASSGFDAASSYGKREANTMLQSPDGTFGGRGVAIKVGIAATTLGVEYLLRRKVGHSKIFALANFFQAGITTGVAARNLGVAPVR